MDLTLSMCLFGLWVLNAGCSSDKSGVLLSPVIPLITELNPLTFTCTYHGHETVLATIWRRNDARVGILLPSCDVFPPGLHSDIYNYYCPSTDEAILTIKNVTIENHGEIWQCIFELNKTVVVSNIVTIFVRVAVQWANITYPNSDVITIPVGDTVEFSCNVSLGRPRPDIAWFSGGTLDAHVDKMLVENITTSFTMHSGYLYSATSTLKYQTTVLDHGVRIYCAANNSIEDIVVSARKPKLNVEYGPVNINFNTSIYTFERAEHTKNDIVLCSADCNPSCLVTWYKDGQITPVSNQPVLDLGTLYPEDNGTYLCNVTRHGSGQMLTKSLTIIVIEKAEAPTDFRYLSCYDVPTFSWRAGKNNGQSQTFIIQSSLVGSNHWLEQTRLKENDEHCLISNDLYISILSNMSPGQHKVRVTAENLAGQSEPVYIPEIINVTENQVSGPSSQQNCGNLTLLIVVVTLNVLIVLSAIYGIYMTMVVRRLKSKTAENNPRTKTMNEPSCEPHERDTTDDILNPGGSQYQQLFRDNPDNTETYEMIKK